MTQFKKPRKFDNNVVVIGAGSAGLVASNIAAVLKSRVMLIERNRMGGDCLNTGCVPSKALIRSAKLLAQARRAEHFGFESINVNFEFANVMERVQRVIKTIEPHDSVERYTSLGVQCTQGDARISSPYTVEVNGKTISTRSIIIATGASPWVPPIPGIDKLKYFTSDNLWGLRKLPRRLLVLGGGPIGTELSQCFARFGSVVTQIEMLPRIMVREDPDVSELVSQRLREDGVNVLTGHRARRFDRINEQNVLVCDSDKGQVNIEFDELLVAVGRRPDFTGLGLTELGVDLRKDGTVETNEYLQTRHRNIFVCGDAAGPYQFTHVASHQAWYAAVNALFGHLKRFKVDYSVIPWCTFTDPEVARVGINEQEATANDIDYEVTRYPLSDLDRAITDATTEGWVKILTVPGKDRILGATMVAEHAGDLLIEYISAMRHGIGMNGILGTIHIYPTLAEANRYAAGIWKKTNAPQLALRFLDWYHRRGRG